jgi:hypothetical protein
MGTSSFGSMGTASGASAELDGNLDFLGDLSFGQKATRLQLMCPWFFGYANQGRHKANILGSASGTSGNRSSTITGRLFPWLSKQGRQKQEFILEMRLLSRLRHPCITTGKCSNGRKTRKTFTTYLLIQLFFWNLVFCSYGSCHIACYGADACYG